MLISRFGLRPRPDFTPDPCRWIRLLGAPLPYCRAEVLAAAHIKACCPISYADAFAVVTAQDYHCVLLTGDPEFHAVEADGLIAVEWLSRR